jgi:hypothetical protein
MRDIRASVEVRALIGAEGLRHLEGDAFVSYDCWWCGGKGRTTEPTSVIVVGRVVKLTHAACADSHIIEAGAGGMGAAAGRGPHRHAASGPGERAGVLAAAGTYRGGGGRCEGDTACAQAGPGR